WGRRSSFQSPTEPRRMATVIQFPDARRRADVFTGRLSAACAAAHLLAEVQEVANAMAHQRLMAVALSASTATLQWTGLAGLPERAMAQWVLMVARSVNRSVEAEGPC